MADVRVLQTPNNYDVLVIATSEAQQQWLSQPSMLFILNRCVRKLFPVVRNLFVVSGSAYDFALTDKAELVSWQMKA